LPTVKISNSKKGLFYQEGLNKALSDWMDHNMSLRKASKDNDIDLVSYAIRPKS